MHFEQASEQESALQQRASRIQKDLQLQMRRQSSSVPAGTQTQALQAEY
jgi:hypothetical protein